MKKVTLMIASLAIFATVSCKDKEEATVVEKETVVVEKEAEPVEEESNGTSISIGKDGVEYSSKDGDKKTEVEIKDDGGTVKVEK
ncbi:hypothetical protein [uncultured Flavobacterium sp.]|uniref:hypothetical protein n=1 Tax=uncultured Flavobacterium sp. TaxID=165435 RepID=UPI0030C81B5C